MSAPANPPGGEGQELRRWKVLESDRPSPMYNGIVCMISASDRVIAVITEDEQPFYPDDWQAAARLIAAAPDLLEALMDIAVLCETGSNSKVDKIARAAILRATARTKE